jgi:GNAT superfamily N-acetyltransferase
VGSVEIREIAEDELERWLAVMRAVRPEQTGGAAEAVDWKRQSAHHAWLLASEGDRDIGAAVGIGGWHEPPGVARGNVRVIEAERGRGVGSALLERLGAWASALGYRELLGGVREIDEESVHWTERRGFVEVGRQSLLVLDLSTVEEPDVAAPPGIEIVTWADRPELVRGMYEVVREAYPDIPGEEDEALPTFEHWRSADMSGFGDRPEATWIALEGGEVVAYAKLSLSQSRPEVAFHDITGVRRAWRRRGIAGALKRAEIAWAKRNGYARMETMNEERNEPIRRLNERHGYKPEPGEVFVRGPIADVSAGS